MEMYQIPDKDGVLRIDAKKFRLPPFLGFDHDCTKTYDLCSFEEYTFARGWTQDAMERDFDAQIRTKADAEFFMAMYQSWMFFGFLEDILQTRIPTKTFVIEEVGKSFLAVQPCLLQYMERLVKTLNAMKPADRKLTFALIDEVRKASDRWASALYNALDADEVPQLLGLDYHTTVFTQLQLLHRHVQYFWTRAGDRLEMLWTYLAHTMPITCHRKQMAELKSKGWCHTTSNSRFARSTTAFEFALVFNVLPQDDPSRHKECKDEMCLANNIDPESYTPRRTAECLCKDLICSKLTLPFARVPTTDLRECSSANEIPLVRCQWLPTKT